MDGHYFEEVKLPVTKGTRTPRKKVKRVQRKESSDLQLSSDEPGFVRLSRWFRSRSARDSLVAMVTALVVGAIITLSQSILDDRRTQGSELAENLRFVRERSSDQAQERPFSGLNLEAQNLNGLMLDSADFSGANLSHATLAKVHLSQVMGEGINLANARIRDSQFRGAQLTEANLTRIIILRSDLSGANLDRITAHAWLPGLGSTVVRSILSAASLKDSELTYWEFAGTDLSGVNMQGADLFLARFSFVNLSGANLSETNVGTASLTNICYDTNTVWPSNFEPPAIEPLACKVPTSLEGLSGLPYPL